MAHGVNIAIVLGNLTRDPELRYTPAGRAVCGFSVATSRSWTTAEGEAQDKTEFHNVVAWNKLAEICSQYLIKGQKVYVQGRLQTRTWEGQDKVRRSRTEIVADQMVMLQRPRGAPAPSGAGQAPVPTGGGVGPVPIPPVKEVDGSEEVKKEIKEEIKKEAISESQLEDQRKPASKGKEDVDPEEVKKKMPF